MTCLHRLSNSRQNEQTPSASNEMSRAEVSMTHLVQTLGGTVFDEGLIGRMSEYKVLQDRQDRALERTSARVLTGAWKCLPGMQLLNLSRCMRMRTAPQLPDGLWKVLLGPERTLG
jgi:hypothetical protein